jgi:hypothetical protein
MAATAAAGGRPRLVVIDAEMAKLPAALRANQLAFGLEVLLQALMGAAVMMDQRLLEQLGRAAGGTFLAHVQARGPAGRALVDPIEEPPAEQAFVRQGFGMQPRLLDQAGGRIANQLARAGLVDRFQNVVARVRPGKQ